jgi:hypothetical protein
VSWFRAFELLEILVFFFFPFLLNSFFKFSVLFCRWRGVCEKRGRKFGFLWERGRR